MGRLRLFDKQESMKIHGRNVEKGTELSIDGVRGRMRFLAYVTNTETGVSWLDCVDRDKHFRSFYVDRVKRVHYKKKPWR